MTSTSTSTSTKPRESCDPVEIAQARREPGVSFTPREVNGKNQTGAYQMSHVAAGGGARWAGAAYDGAALWDGTRRLRHIPCSTRSCTPNEVAFAADGKTLLVGVSRFDIESGQGTALDVITAVHSTSMNEVEAVAWAPDGSLALAAMQHRPSRCCRDRAAASPTPPPRFLAIDGASGALIRDLGPRNGKAMAVGPASIFAVAAGGLTAWDRATFAPTTRAGMRPNRLLLHPSGALLASADRGEVTLWRLQDFCPVARFVADAAFVHAMAFHPTAPVLFTSGGDRAIHAFSTERPGVELGAYQVPDARRDMSQVTGALAVTSDGRLLVAPLYMDERVIALEIAIAP